MRGSLRGTPAVNTALLAFGASIASIVGTTGASMILIAVPLAVFLAQKSKLSAIYQTIYFLPFITPMVPVSIAWKTSSRLRARSA